MTRTAAVTVAVIAMALGSGCAARSSGAQPASPLSAEAIAALDLPSKDRESWALPLDEYEAASAPEIQNHAENLLVSECLQEAGFRWPIAPVPLEDAYYVTAFGIRLFDSDIARDWGYHDPDSAARAPRIANMSRMNAIAQSQPGFDAVYTACLTEVREALPSAIDYVNFISSGADQANEMADADPAARAAAAVWQDCLADAGYDGAPSNPNDMPTAEMRERAHIPQPGNGDGAPETELTDGEIALAMADASCRESSGWARARYDAEWNGQAAFIAANTDRLAEERAAWVDLRAELLGVIATHAPLQPDPEVG